MEWRAAGDGFVVPRGMRTQFAGEESWRCRCGNTIEAQPLFDQTCQIEAALAAPETWIRMDDGNGHINRLTNLPLDNVKSESDFGRSFSIAGFGFRSGMSLMLALTRHK